MKNPLTAVFAIFVIAISIGVSLWPSQQADSQTPRSQPSTRSTPSGHSTAWARPMPSLTSSAVSVQQAIPRAPVAPSVATSPAATTPPAPVPPPSVASEPSPATAPPTTEPSSAPSPPTTTPPTPSSSGDPWAKVAWCEEGGTVQYQEDGPWFDSGSAYPDSLGISSANWYANGGGSDVSEAAQDAVAYRIQADPPDQGAIIGVSRSGCAAW